MGQMQIHSPSQGPQHHYPMGAPHAQKMLQFGSMGGSFGGAAAAAAAGGGGGHGGEGAWGGGGLRLQLQLQLLGEQLLLDCGALFRPLDL
jgi:hypothetical protein